MTISLGASGELAALASAIGLLDESGELDLEWFSTPLTKLEGAVRTPSQRAALAQFFDLALPPDAAAAAGRRRRSGTRCSGTSDQGNLYLTLADTGSGLVLGLAGDFHTGAGAAVPASLRMQADVVAANGGVDLVIGTDGAPDRRRAAGADRLAVRPAGRPPGGPGRRHRPVHHRPRPRPPERVDAGGARAAEPGRRAARRHGDGRREPRPRGTRPARRAAQGRALRGRRRPGRHATGRPLPRAVRPRRRRRDPGLPVRRARRRAGGRAVLDVPAARGLGCADRRTVARAPRGPARLGRRRGRVRARSTRPGGSRSSTWAAARSTRPSRSSTATCGSASASASVRRSAPASPRCTSRSRSRSPTCRSTVLRRPWSCRARRPSCGWTVRAAPRWSTCPPSSRSARSGRGSRGTARRSPRRSSCSTTGSAPRRTTGST